MIFCCFYFENHVCMNMYERCFSWQEVSFDDLLNYFDIFRSLTANQFNQAFRLDLYCLSVLINFVHALNV